jgi:hypothetical protein
MNAVEAELETATSDSAINTIAAATVRNSDVRRIISITLTISWCLSGTTAAATILRDADVRVKDFFQHLRFSNPAGVATTTMPLRSVDPTTIDEDKKFKIDNVVALSVRNVRANVG